MTFSWIVDFSDTNNEINNYNNDDNDDLDLNFKENFDKYCKKKYGFILPFNIVVIETINEYRDDKLNIDYDFDKIFSAIIESNNILPLFILFTKGISVNERNPISKTILHYAIKSGNNFLIKLILSCEETDPFICDENNETPIIYSIKYKEKAFSSIWLKSIKKKY